MSLIGKPCICTHDVLDHYDWGCIRCRWHSRLGFDWRHAFRRVVR